MTALVVFLACWGRVFDRCCTSEMSCGKHGDVLDMSFGNCVILLFVVCVQALTIRVCTRTQNRVQWYRLRCRLCHRFTERSIAVQCRCRRRSRFHAIRGFLTKECPDECFTQKSPSEPVSPDPKCRRWKSGLLATT